MNACPCNGAGRRERCSCRDIDAAARAYVPGPALSPDPAAAQRPGIFSLLTSTPCTCGAAAAAAAAASPSPAECTHADHIRALDLRAAAFSLVAAAYPRARKDAEWALQLAPRRLEGWLRLGQVACLQGQHELAWRVWSEGIAVGRRFAPAAAAADPRLAKLRELVGPLARKYARQDPLAALPLEVVCMVFSHFGWRTAV
jgi:hypothetical protein